MMKILSINNLKPKIDQIRNFFGYVRHAFNTVDGDRLKLVGPDRLCAEWVLKNGGAVKFAEAPSMKRDYNTLPPENVKLTINVIDASNSSIMQEGFQHLIGCQHISKIILHNCKHLEGDGLKELVIIKTTLNYLQVSGCHNINDSGMMHCKNLHNLKELKIFDMPFIKNIDNVVNELKKSLPQCKFELP